MSYVTKIPTSTEFSLLGLITLLLKVYNFLLKVNIIGLAVLI